MNTNEQKPVSLHYGDDGRIDGILVKTFDESFVIDLHDAEGGRIMDWQKAIQNYEDVMPSKKQALIIGAYSEEINRLLKDAGGEELNGWYWTKTEYLANYAWLYYGYTGCVNGNHKYYSYSVRPVRASA